MWFHRGSPIDIVVTYFSRGVSGPRHYIVEVLDAHELLRALFVCLDIVSASAWCTLNAAIAGIDKPRLPILGTGPHFCGNSCIYYSVRMDTNKWQIAPPHQTPQGVESDKETRLIGCFGLPYWIKSSHLFSWQPRAAHHTCPKE